MGIGERRFESKIGPGFVESARGGLDCVTWEWGKEKECVSGGSKFGEGERVKVAKGENTKLYGTSDQKFENNKEQLEN